MGFYIMLQAFTSIQQWLRQLEESQKKVRFHLCTQSLLFSRDLTQQIDTLIESNTDCVQRSVNGCDSYIPEVYLELQQALDIYFLRLFCHMTQYSQYKERYQLHFASLIKIIQSKIKGCKHKLPYHNLIVTILLWLKLFTIYLLQDQLRFQAYVQTHYQEGSYEPWPSIPLMHHNQHILALKDDEISEYHFEQSYQQRAQIRRLRLFVFLLKGIFPVFQTWFKAASISLIVQAQNLFPNSQSNCRYALLLSFRCLMDQQHPPLNNLSISIWENSSALKQKQQQPNYYFNSVRVTASYKKNKQSKDGFTFFVKNHVNKIMILDSNQLCIFYNLFYLTVMFQRNTIEQGSTYNVNPSHSMRPNFNTHIQPNGSPVFPNQINYTELNNIPTYNLTSSYNTPMMKVNNSFHQDNQQKIQTLDRMTSETLNTGTFYFTDFDEETRTQVKAFTKEPSERHFGILCYTLMFVLTTVFIVIQFGGNELIEPVFIILPIIITYVIYFLGTLSCVSLWPYFKNMNSYDHILNIHQQLKQSTGQIKLSVQCYHYTPGRHRAKITTHVATQMIPVRECVDISQPLDQMKQDHKFLFCRMKKYFCFGDQNSQNTFINTFRFFMANHTQDTHRTFTHSLIIGSIEPQQQIGLYIIETGKWLRHVYVLFVLIGLGYPFIMLIEAVSQRYSINVIKRLTL